MRRPNPRLVKCRAVIIQCSERGPPALGPSRMAKFRKTAWEENELRVRVEENLLRVEAMELRNGLSRYGVYQ
jgi:hypothetical protein